MQPRELADSYRYCQQVTQKQAKNFYYGIRLLPTQKRLSLCAMYAFFRYCDDVSDGEIQGSRSELLQQWRRAIDENKAGTSRLLPAFYDAKQRHAIPSQYFHSMIDGVEADLCKNRYHNFEELYRYCYCVASTVGLVCIHVYGFDSSPEALQMAEWRGIAFQLTNILRDISEDLNLGRMYLPLDELQAHGLAVETLAQSQDSPQLRQFLQQQIRRARDYYQRAAGLEERVEADCRSSLQAMTAIYHCLLGKVESMGATVLRKRARLSTLEKLRLAGQTLLSGSR